MNKNDPILVDLFNVVDNVMKLCTEMGWGVVNSAAPVTNNMEEEMWQSGVLGEHTPAQLLEIIMFLIGVNCALGCNKHCHLRHPGFNEQIRVGVDSDNAKCLKFRANVKSKTNQGGMKHKFIQPKTVHTYENPNAQWCPVHIYKKYIGLLSTTLKSDALYLQPKLSITPKCWYIDHPMGINYI